MPWLGNDHPSNSEHASVAFLVLKTDKMALPRWVNDYWMLNANTVIDSHPLPQVDNVLTDCVKGKVWSHMDMMNSFFQMCMHLDDAKLMAITTPCGLYEWLVMPMGLQNVPAIHQHRVTAVLYPYIGRFCHVYLDNIVIWSDSIAKHFEHTRTILKALKDTSLYCNPKKCDFFLLELDFLGHHVSV